VSLAAALAQSFVGVGGWLSHSFANTAEIAHQKGVAPKLTL